MTTEIYRFRPVCRLLGDCGELDQQYIYFAHADQLNDPTEGFKNIYWRGDQVVWRNLFRHYLYCLHMTFCTAKICGSDEKVLPQHIPVLMTPPLHPPDPGYEIFEEILREAFGDLGIDDFVANLENQDRMIYRDELLCYIDPLHMEVLPTLQRVHARHGLGSNPVDLPENYAPFRSAHKALALVPSITDEEFRSTLYSYLSQWGENRYASHRHGGRLDSLDGLAEANRKFIVYDFPRTYLRELERLIFPPWYAACFVRNYSSISMWSHYADEHKGVCLIFGAETTNASTRIPLRRITSYSNHGEHWSMVPMEVSPVQYVHRLKEIDFFGSLGRVPMGVLESSWYTDRDGNVSRFLSDLTGKGETEWRKAYWRRFLEVVTSKPKDWEYERESRMILYSLLSDLDDESKRRLTFDFKSLKGIIFGVHTPDTDKVRLLDVIRKKCRDNEVSDFKVFQAFYSSRSGVIDKAPIPIRVCA